MNFGRSPSGTCCFYTSKCLVFIGASCVRGRVAASSSNHRYQQSTPTHQQVVSRGLHSTSARCQRTHAAGGCSSSSGDVVSLFHDECSSPSPANCAPSSHRASDHRIDPCRDAYPRHMDARYCTGMTSYPGHDCSERCFNQYVVY